MRGPIHQGGPAVRAGGQVLLTHSRDIYKLTRASETIGLLRFHSPIAIEKRMMSEESDYLRKILKELKDTNEKLDRLAENVDFFIRNEVDK